MGPGGDRLPEALRDRGYRLAAFVWAVALFGVLSVLTIYHQVKENL